MQTATTRLREMALSDTLPDENRTGNFALTGMLQPCAPALIALLVFGSPLSAAEADSGRRPEQTTGKASVKPRAVAPKSRPPAAKSGATDRTPFPDLPRSIAAQPTDPLSLDFQWRASNAGVPARDLTQSTVNQVKRSLPGRDATPDSRFGLGLKFNY